MAISYFDDFSIDPLLAWKDTAGKTPTGKTLEELLKEDYTKQEALFMKAACGVFRYGKGCGGGLDYDAGFCAMFFGLCPAGNDPQQEGWSMWRAALHAGEDFEEQYSAGQQYGEVADFECIEKLVNENVKVNLCIKKIFIKAVYQRTLTG